MKETDPHQNEQYKSQRKRERKIIPVDVNVFNNLENSHVGLLVNITVEGLMIIADNEISADSIFQYELRMPNDLGAPEKMIIGVDCLWCQPAVEAGKYWAGFHIIDISENDFESLEHLIEEHGLESEV